MASCLELLGSVTWAPFFYSCFFAAFFQGFGSLLLQRMHSQSPMWSMLL